MPRKGRTVRFFLPPPTPHSSLPSCCRLPPLPLCGARPLVGAVCFLYQSSLNTQKNKMVTRGRVHTHKVSSQTFHHCSRSRVHRNSNVKRSFSRWITRRRLQLFAQPSAHSYHIGDTQPKTSKHKTRAHQPPPRAACRAVQLHLHGYRVFFINNCAHKTPEAAAPRVAGYTASTYPVH